MGGVAPAHALITMNGWKIDLGALGDLSGIGQDNFTGYGVLGANGTPAGSLGINSMAFQALYYSNGTFTGPATPSGNLPAVGDKFNTDLAGAVTQVTGNAGFIPKTSTNQFINSDFEVTFVATTTQQVTSVAPVTFVTTHQHLLAGAGPDGFTNNGFLDLYADALGMGDNAGVVANTNASGGGTGLNDGTLIGRFQIMWNGPASGSFNPSAKDGQDSAKFVMVANPYNILLDKDSLPLVVGETYLFTDSNTDGDDDNNGIYDTVPGKGLFAGICGLPQTNDNTCGVEDGSANLKVVPEPGSLALLGLGMAGLFGIRRRRAA